MSVFTDAQVQILVADFASTDLVGKLNVIGAGIALIGVQANGLTAPMTVAVTISVPMRHSGSEYSLAVELHDISAGAIVQIPGPESEPQAMRIQQVVTTGQIQVPPGFARPSDAMVQHTMPISFPTGLGLPPGHSYEWRVQIDGQQRPGWWARFHVLGAAPPIVIGGPSNPSDIPGVQPPSTD